MCGSDRTGSSEDSDGDEEDESSMMNWVIPPAHPPQARVAAKLEQDLRMDPPFDIRMRNAQYRKVV